MAFLPEEDQEFLDEKRIVHELLTEKLPNGTERRAVLFPSFAFAGNLQMQKEGSLTPCASCDVLVVIPDGYATTRLDSFYTLPRLKRPDGGDPDRANSDTALFGKSWQFWSRHLDETEWRVGVDGLRTFLNYVRAELRNAA